MFSTSAPYVVTVMMSVITWVLSTYYENIVTTPYLRYETTEDGRNASPPYVVYRFTNASPKVRISGVTIGLDCPTDKACFGAPGTPVDAYAQMLKVPPWAMPDEISPSPTIVTQKIDLPAGTAFEIRVVLISKDTKPFLYFQSEPGHKVDLKLIDKYSLDQFVANNYLSIVAVLWTAACLVIFVAYRSANAAAVKTKDDRKEPQTIHLKIIEN